MTEPVEPYAGWQPLPEEAPRSPRVRIFLFVALGLSVLFALVYGIAFLNDPSGTDGLMLLIRASIAASGAVLLGVARLVARTEPGRIKSALSLGSTIFVAGLVDALYLLFDAAADVPGLVRTLGFLFMGILVGTQLLLLLRKGRSDEDTIAGFFAKNATVVAFLLFLIVARIALKDVLATLLPALFLNLIFLVTFLWAAVYLIARFLKRFGSPISWGDAKRHEQTVERLNDTRMEDVRALLKQYIDTGRKLPEYQDMMRSVMHRVEANPAEIEPLLVRAPAPIRPALTNTPPGILLAATFSIALALGVLAAGGLSIMGTGAGLFIVVVIATGVVQPLVSGLLRASETDPAPIIQFWLAALLCGIGAASLYVALPALVFGAGVGGVFALLYVGLGVAQLLRQKQPRGPDHAFLRAEAAETQARRARGLMFWGGGIALATPVWYVVALAAGRWIALQNPPLPLTIAGIVAGALFAASGYFLGPLLRGHREEVRGLHKQETGLRQSYHRLLVKKLEGART